jgi:hypothetical protein
MEKIPAKRVYTTKNVEYGCQAHHNRTHGGIELQDESGADAEHLEKFESRWLMQALQRN